MSCLKARRSPRLLVREFVLKHSVYLFCKRYSLSGEAEITAGCNKKPFGAETKRQNLRGVSAQICAVGETLKIKVAGYNFFT
jgi:hypothetical protein